MRYIDAFNHFFPAKYFARMIEVAGQHKDIGKRVRNIPCLHDLDVRFRVMDEFKDKNYSQVLSVAAPPIEDIATGEVALELARLNNDGLAELCQQHPDRFVGYVANLPMGEPDNAAREAERALKNGANGLQLYTNVKGKPLDLPEFFPIFEIAAKSGKPILIHPARGADMPDYKTEQKSKYEIWWTFGWPYETSVMMARLVFSGVMDKLPDLKMVAHHFGAMVPYFEGRVGPGWDQLGNRTSDEDYKTTVLAKLKKRPFDYFKDYYADTATFGSRGAMICGLDFYGPDKTLFASDSPFDPEKGPGYIRDTIRVLESIDMPQADREKICHGNAEKLFGIAAQ
jgi:predicted TIM-barrel fold metal-dependent hydrolase